MMFANMWQSISNWASDIIESLPTADSEEPIISQTLDYPLDPLALPDPPDVRRLLTLAAVPIEIATHYEKSFNELIYELSEYVKAKYEDAVMKIHKRASFDISVQPCYFRALRNGLIVYYNDSVQQALLSLKSRLATLESHPKISSSLPSVSSPNSSGSESHQNRRGRPFVFSKDQTAVLRALLVHDDQFSNEEKELIAQTLNLTRAQVNRWFCNARARGGRKKPYEKPIPRAQRQNLGKYVSDVCQNQRRNSSLSSSESSRCSRYSSSDDDVEMWPCTALQNSDTDDSPYLTTEADPSENIIPMAQLYSQMLSACDDTSPTNQTTEMDTNLPSSNFSFSESTSSLNEFLLPNDLSSLFTDPDPFNLNTLPDDGFAQSLSLPSSHSEESWKFS
ncbi:putative b mating type locus [Melampsora larici-populina 98AG31]|uniref:Putative b mating type locus n=1 Tax=Melampsora larici-populina (strain 98AG31 / pathotype 3-4-7) TaxID=747676 RepID=F4RVY3_MELLP|nr:putative b mating type locus [Melampsora larici-populina 98AG31]EGG03439.1 putative b mating type locus [Melampsora larici-populina 98AG31]